MQAWQPGAGEGSAGASQRGIDGVLDVEDASPSWREKLGVSLSLEEGRLNSQGIVWLECTCCLLDTLSSHSSGGWARTWLGEQEGNGFSEGFCF